MVMLLHKQIFFIDDEFSLEYSLFHGSPETTKIYSFRLVAIVRNGRHTQRKEQVSGGQSTVLEETIESAMEMFKKVINNHAGARIH